MFGTSAIVVFPLGTYRVLRCLWGQSACRLYMRAALRQDAIDAAAVEAVA